MWRASRRSNLGLTWLTWLRDLRVAQRDQLNQAGGDQVEHDMGSIDLRHQGLQVGEPRLTIDHQEQAPLLGGERGGELDC